MGNIHLIRNSSGELIAQSSQSIVCLARASAIAGKYDKWLGNGTNFLLHTDEFMRRLNKISDKLNSGEAIAIAIYLNDQYTLTFDPDIEGLNQAIAEYPPNWDEGPKKILVKMRELLTQHRSLSVSYDHTIGSSVTSGDKTTLTL